MKKTLVALAVLSAAAVAQAAPQANTFYAGAKAGWASFHDGLTQFDHKDGGEFGINRNSVTYGVFGGYQILNQNNFGLATELGYDYFGRVRGNKTFEGENSDKRAAKHSAHGAHLSLKPSYEVVPNLDVYGKVGVALVRNDYYVQQNVAKDSRIKAHNLKPSLLLGAGLEYAITPELAARVEYQYLNRVGNLDKAARKTANIEGTNFQYSPDIHSVSAGLSYRFGQGAAPVEAPEVVTKNFAFSSDVLFDFGKSSLKPAAATSLDAAHAEISNLGLANPAIQVNGYTDRIGKEASNLKLSQRRAETVANYIVSKGTNPANVTAVGYGEANPVTGHTCDAVKGRKALIACLAPDRRVEIQVQGSKEVTM
ncbi:Outer membrane protein P5 precursor [Mannheimia haemolytica]|uniref:Outer membrane protein A n=2 Tax=Mannheimia TaxID=75984 RepID=A0A3S5B1Z0_MANHA|nr:porin OmpA [Mannheimia haemolytica]AAO85793.1 heat-modifiable outer membrane protein [Mannheimia glucosida]AAO85794.1 heat-modifiable outer membrane protein [Mannheimia glucosida]UQX67786.1 porin OmpA [Mannheimia haemolytica]STY61945.1 Outer membrane protein P5 precursor [Mannheimia haemolytica]VEI75178.1 Outer membrane protein P5 precursor [Mannheimia haemolytica]